MMKPSLAVLKTKSGFLKLVHVVLGVIAFGCEIGIIVHIRNNIKTEIYRDNMVVLSGIEFYTELIIFTFTLMSSLLLMTSILEEPREISKSLFELVYHLVGFLLQLSVGLCLAIPLSEVDWVINESTINSLYYTTMICTFLNTIAYGVHAIVTALHKLRRN